jgi:hypothetical protein
MRIGTKVRLKKGVAYRPGPRLVGRITHRFSDIKGGVVVDRRLDGVFRCWNVSDLERV